MKIRILAIETATDVCSVAVWSETGLIGKTNIYLPKEHARLLPPIAEKLLSLLQLAPTDITAVAVSDGPGSYTGLRIGSSVAKGICMGLNIPLVAIPTHLGLAAQLKPLAAQLPDAKIIPLIDARRMEVYAAVYDSELNCLSPPTPEIITEHSFEHWSGTLLFAGTGSAKTQPLLQRPNRLFFNHIVCDAQTIAELGYAAIQAGKVSDWKQYEPFYLKEVAINTTKRSTFPQNQHPIDTSVH